MDSLSAHIMTPLINSITLVWMIRTIREKRRKEERNFWRSRRKKEALLSSSMKLAKVLMTLNMQKRSNMFLGSWHEGQL